MNAPHPDKPVRRRYPSDLSDRSWGRVAAKLPPDPKRGRKRSTDVREVVNGINYRWTTGCTWRMLPHDFPPWETIYSYFRRWMRDGTLRKLRDELIRRQAAASVDEPRIAARLIPREPSDRVGLRVWSPDRNGVPDEVSNPEKSPGSTPSTDVAAPPDVA